VEDRWVVAMAGAAAAGALHPWRVGLLIGAGTLILALVARRPVLVCLAVGLLASGLVQRSLDGLDGLEQGLVSGEATLLTDPAPSFGGLQADVRLGGRRFLARADGSAASVLEARLAGEVLRLRGRVSPLAGEEPWAVARHLSGRLTVLAVEGWRGGDPSARAANGLRRTLEAGAAPLSERQRSLFTGLVIGDDRRQPVDLADDFLGAGLTHLLAVSGQNVAFVLALSGPLLRRLRLWPRLLVTLAVIALFGVMTRFEPSVLRASAMAGLAATVAMGGRPVSRLRIVGLAVTGLLLVDPLLVRSAGFQLSVCAATAIVALAPRLTAVLPGPAPLREALGVTLAAQLGVAPVLLLTFGPVPVASLPANLFAVPVAGLVMIWGLTAGMVAGLSGSPLAGILHVPTRLALAWLELVADRAARAPLGELRLAHMAVLATGLALAVVARERRTPRRVGLGVAALALGAAVVAAQAPPPLRSSPVPGVTRWHAGGTDVVVVGGAGGGRQLGAPAVLEGLRRHGVGTIDLLVVADPSVPEPVVAALVDAHPTVEVLAAGGAALDGLRRPITRAPPDGAVLQLGALTLRVVVVPGRLVVDVVPRDR
jgi:competence protein ComEC